MHMYLYRGIHKYRGIICTYVYRYVPYVYRYVIRWTFTRSDFVFKIKNCFWDTQAKKHCNYLPQPNIYVGQSHPENDLFVLYSKTLQDQIYPKISNLRKSLLDACCTLLWGERHTQSVDMLKNAAVSWV